MLKLADNLSLPIEAVTQTFALLARRGAGKTHAASVLAEEMLSAGHCITWLDPIGVAWGLRSDFPIVIFGGERKDVPLEPTAGKIVAEFLVGKRVPALLDLSAFGENEMRRFVGDFCQRFYHLNRQPVHVFIDEADEFAPQSASGGEIAKCLGAMQNLVRRGRVRGIGVTLITQRSAVLNKSVLTQTECLIAMQTTAPHDLRAIEDWIKYHGTPEQCRSIMATLPKLQQGEAWVYSPGWLNKLQRVKFRHRTSFDSSRTPKPGEKARAPATLADVDVPALTKEIESTIERAKADDPKELRRQNAELQKQLNEAKRVGEAAGEIADLRKRLIEADKLLKRISSTADEGAELLHNVPDEVPALKKGGPNIHKNIPPQRAKYDYLTGKGNSHPPSRKALTSLGKPERSILTAFYWLRDENVTPAKIGFYANYTAGSGSFNNALGRLRSQGLVSGWKLTDTGCALIAQMCDDKPTGQELREWLRRKLGKAENALLDALCDAYPNRLTDEELGDRARYTTGSGSFNNALGRLRSIEAAEGYARDGGAKAADLFFETN